MPERKLNVQHIDPKTNKCGPGGFGGRPDARFCPNDPITKPDNHRPKVCEGCAASREAWKMASYPLPDIYIVRKQEEFSGGQTIIFSPSMIKKTLPTIEDIEPAESSDNI